MNRLKMLIACSLLISTSQAVLAVVDLNKVVASDTQIVITGSGFNDLNYPATLMLGGEVILGGCPRTSFPKEGYYQAD